MGEIKSLGSNSPNNSPTYTITSGTFSNGQKFSIDIEFILKDISSNVIAKKVKNFKGIWGEHVKAIKVAGSPLDDFDGTSASKEFTISDQ